MPTTISSTTSPPPQTTIRPAKFSELYQCAQILAKSFVDHELFGVHMHPHREQYPDDMALYWYRALQVEYWDWAMVLLVATERDQGSGEEVITGVAQWHRLGETARKYGWGLAGWDPRRLLHPLSTSTTHLLSLVHPNRAISPTEADILTRGAPFTTHIFTTPPHRADHWNLHFLGVHPAHHKKGIGRLLVSWGLDRAREEGVGAFVIAADGKDVFYQRCGFRKLLGRAGDGEGNPLQVIPGGNIWWVGWEGLMGKEEEEEEGVVVVTEG